MASIFKGLTTIGQIIGTGIMRLTGWLFSRYEEKTDRTDFLAGRYPDAPPSSIDQVYTWMDAAHGAAGYNNPSGNFPPPDLSAAFSPGTATQHVWEIDVYARRAATSRAGIPIHVTIKAPNALADPDLLLAALHQADWEFQRMLNDSPKRLKGYALWNVPRSIDVSAYWIE